MATNKKHIAVYLDPAVQKALLEFCKQKGLISKKGTMYSAGVNTALASFFGVSGSEVDNGNIPQVGSNIPDQSSTIPSSIVSNILQSPGNIPSNMTSDILSNIPAESIDIEVLPGKFRA
jgi:hypothetical protein